MDILLLINKTDDISLKYSETIANGHTFSKSMLNGQMTYKHDSNGHITHQSQASDGNVMILTQTNTH